MKPHYLILITTLIIASCGRKKPLPKATDIAKIVKVTLMPPPPLHEYVIPPHVDTSHLLLSNTAQRFFSDTVVKDNFSITFYGANVRHGTFVLKILNPAKGSIHQSICDVSDYILNYEKLNAQQQTDTVNSIMKHFFDDDNFHQPALRNNEKLADNPENYNETMRTIWNEIKADSKAISFRYQSDYKTVESITFSKKLQQVIRVFYIEYPPQ